MYNSSTRKDSKFSDDRRYAKKVSRENSKDGDEIGENKEMFCLHLDPGRARGIVNTQLRLNARDALDRAVMKLDSYVEFNSQNGSIWPAALASIIG